jgi:hypothetical protein
MVFVPPIKGMPLADQSVPTKAAGPDKPLSFTDQKTESVPEPPDADPVRSTVDAFVAVLRNCVLTVSVIGVIAPVGKHAATPSRAMSGAVRTYFIRLLMAQHAHIPATTPAATATGKNVTIFHVKTGINCRTFRLRRHNRYRRERAGRREPQTEHTDLTAQR